MRFWCGPRALARLRLLRGGGGGGALPLRRAAPAAASAQPAFSSAPSPGGDAPPDEAWPPPTSAYVHLPFCKLKCKYCDFPVVAVGMRADGAEEVRDAMAAHVDLLLREIAATAPPAGAPPLRTVYFGGGTPSLIAPRLLEKLLRALDAAYGLAPGAEVSMEADPGTFDAAKLRAYAGVGVSRLSVGVQSFDDALLATCGRAHGAADALRAIEAVYASAPPGGWNWSLDLMSGLPGLTPAGWAATLAAALDAAPRHASVYDLQLEPGTPFGAAYRPGAAPLPSHEAAADMYAAASAALRAAGFEHYEVSNYALRGGGGGGGGSGGGGGAPGGTGPAGGRAAPPSPWRCAHNMAYWTGAPYYAFGLGAASHLGGVRFSRPRRPAGYAAWVAEFEARAAAAAAGGRREPPSGGAPPAPPAERLTDDVMLRLRLADGLDLAWLADAYRPHGLDATGAVLAAVAPHVERGLVEVAQPEEGGGGAAAGATRARAARPPVVRLTDPAGFLLSNDVISDVFAEIAAREKG